MTIANREMAALWDGSEGADWADNADRYEQTGDRHWQALLRRVPIGPDDAVLDIGCGTGKSSRNAARLATSGSVLGIDLSARMLERARDAAGREGLDNVRFEQGDAQVHPFPDATYDVAISTFGAMFFADPVAAFANIRRSLRPGGRLGVLAWRELARNEWLTEIRAALAAGRDLPAPPTGVPGPFGLAEADRAGTVLGEAGFGDVAFHEVDEPLRLGSDAADAFEFVRTMGVTKGLTQDLGEADRAAALERLRACLVRHETDGGVLFGSSAWLITGRAGDDT